MFFIQYGTILQLVQEGVILGQKSGCVNSLYTNQHFLPFLMDCCAPKKRLIPRDNCTQ